MLHGGSLTPPLQVAGISAAEDADTQTRKHGLTRFRSCVSPFTSSTTCSKA